MRIVHLIDYYQPRVGYQEYFLAREHARLGLETYVVTSDRYFPFPNYDNTYRKLLGPRFAGYGEENSEGINIIRLKSAELPGTNLILLKHLKKTLHKIKPDLVLCHGIYSFTSFLISKYKKTNSFNLVFDNHAAAFNTDFNKSLPARFYHFLFKTFFAHSIINNADKIFAIGEAERDFICHDLGLPEKKIPIIRLGVDTALFRYSARIRKEIRSKYKIKDSSKVIIFTGKISPNKKVYFLAEALERISKGSLVLLLIGGGPDDYLNKIKKITDKTRLIHLAFIDNNKLPGFYSAADLAVWPGDSSIAILEAMSCRLPLILPVWQGTEFLDKSEGIIRFNRNSAFDLLHKIKYLTYNRDLSRKSGYLNQQYVRKYLDWKKIAREILHPPDNKPI